MLYTYYKHKSQTHTHTHTHTNTLFNIYVLLCLCVCMYVYICTRSMAIAGVLHNSACIIMPYDVSVDYCTYNNNYTCTCLPCSALLSGWAGGRIGVYVACVGGIHAHDSGELSYR